MLGWIERPLHYFYVFASCWQLLVILWDIWYIKLLTFDQRHWDKLEFSVLAADKCKIFIVYSDCCLLETGYRKLSLFNASVLGTLKILSLVETEDHAVKTVSAITCFDTPQAFYSLSLHYSHTVVAWCTHRTFVSCQILSHLPIPFRSVSLT